MSCANILHQPVHRTREILRYVAHRSCRHTSTSSNPYPYPTHPHPRPHQIFHLPRSATQQQIKERCRWSLHALLNGLLNPFFPVLDYDLVRIYHPDSPIARKYPADIAQARFQSISKAYDLMRGKSDLTGDAVTSRERPADPARFRPRATRRRHFDETVGDERWKERILFGATLLVSLMYSS